MKRPPSSSAVTLIPPHRASTRSSVEIRISAGSAAACRVSINLDGQPIRSTQVELSSTEPFTVLTERIGLPGNVWFSFEFLDEAGDLVGHVDRPYEIVDSGVRSTRRIDGCWISVVHWSEDEARHFNADLKRLSAEDWADQIGAMNDVGIKSVLVQNVFDSDRYAGRHDMTEESYAGAALYPSRLYAERYPLATADPLEAILAAADERGMTVFMGVGLFAWFDFSPASLEWHKRVTAELQDMYGHHPSLYGWYVSEEMFGSLYDEWPHLPAEAYQDIVRFFRDYWAFVQALTPTKPVALAPNNIRFHEFAREWGEILPHIDVLIPFAFARDRENLNIAQIQAICDRAGTHLWVDMEMFDFPLDNGLVPKTIDALVREIAEYDDVEQIFGYQFTGLMNPPDSPFNLGGRRAKELYTDYARHFESLERLAMESQAQPTSAGSTR